MKLEFGNLGLGRRQKRHAIDVRTRWACWTRYHLWVLSSLCMKWVCATCPPFSSVMNAT